MDIESGGLFTGDNDIGVIQGPFEPMAEKMSFEPAVMMVRILQKFQIINFKNDLSIRRVNISS